MSFLLDPPALVVIGIVLGRHVHDRTRRRRLAVGVVAVFLLISSLQYLDVIPWWWGGWMSGTNWMLNSGLDTQLSRSAGTDVLAVVLLAAYPLWIGLGLVVGRSRPAS